MTATVSTTRPLDPVVREKLARVGTADIANALLRRGLSNVVMHGVHPLGERQAALVGPAFTLRFIPAREDLDHLENYGSDDNLHRVAIERCPAGSVLVIDAFGSSRASSMGGMMAGRLARRGVAGVVTDGGYRDGDGIRATGLPCYQRRPAVPATPIALHPVALDEPIGCGGVAVYPGDVVVGDRDGVVVIPAHLAAEVADEAIAAIAYEEFAAMQIADGRSLFGLFPATRESTSEYEEWARHRRCAPEGTADDRP